MSALTSVSSEEATGTVLPVSSMPQKKMFGLVIILFLGFGVFTLFDEASISNANEPQWVNSENLISNTSMQPIATPGVYHYCPGSPKIPDCPTKPFEDLSLLVLIPEFRDPELFNPLQIEALRLNILNCLKKLPTYWNFRIGYTPENRHIVRAIISNVTKETNTTERFTFEEHTQKKIARPKEERQYSNESIINTILLSRQWWTKLHDAKVDWVMVVQADAFICKEGDPKFAWPYMGGSSTELPSGNFGGLKLRAKNFTGHINGGFSLRNVEWSLNVVIPWWEKQPRPPPKEGCPCDKCCEDVQFSKSLIQREAWNISWQDVAAFATDNNGNSNCFLNSTGHLVCPYAVHKPIRYHFFKEECPGYQEWFEIFRWPRLP